jgi:DNA-binding GntR family transcriptional regulator
MIVARLSLAIQMALNIRELTQVAKEADGFFSITWFAEKAGVSWTQAKLILFRLMAQGLVDGQEILHRGWIFRAKTKAQEISVKS